MHPYIMLAISNSCYPLLFKKITEEMCRKKKKTLRAYLHAKTGNNPNAGKFCSSQSDEGDQEDGFSLCVSPLLLRRRRRLPRY